MKNLYLLIVIALFSCTKDNNSKIVSEKEKPEVEVLLLGLSHWNNYKSAGLDVAQTDELDILSDQYQKDLNEIIEQIVAFNPDKIFVERPVSYQPKLDSLYNLYKTTDWGKNYRNEIYQLGFKTASKLNHTKVYGVDYRETSFPYGKLMAAMKEAKQDKLIKDFNDDIALFEKSYNKLVTEKKPLKDFIYFMNDKEQRKSDLNWYINGANKGGLLENTTGSFLAAEWIKRNIYTYGYMQKYVEPKDDKIMIIMGASHIAVLDNLISYNKKWKTVELKDIMEK